jgi:uncharacterized protein (TIGR02147 family)
MSQQPGLNQDLEWETSLSKLQELLYINDPRVFLRKALELQYKSVNLADFSRRAGFSSRSFLSLYLSGKKGLSANSLAMITEALKLPKDYKRLFLMIASKDDQKLTRKLNIKASLEVELLHQKASIIQKEKVKNDINQHGFRLTSRYLFRVFASIGTKERGESLNLICTKSKLTKKVAQEALEVLINLGLVEKKSEKYFPVSTEVDLLDLNESEFRSFIKNVFNDIANNSDLILEERNNIMLYYAFSMDSYNKSKFKERVQHAILDVINEFQSDQGSCIREFAISCW